MNNVKKTTVAAAVAGVLGGAGLLGSGAVQADAVMFPYVVNSATVTTVVNIVNTSNDLYNASGIAGVGGNFTRLHWRLNNKNGGSATDNAAACGEIDFFLPTSQFDLQTVDLGGDFGASTSGVLFNDPSINNNWQGNLGSLTYALAGTVPIPSRSVLLVDNADTVVTPPFTFAASIAGEAFIYEFGSGAAWGYQAPTMNNASGAGDNGVAEMNFGNVSLLGFTPGGALSMLTSHPVLSPGGFTTFMPPEETVTRYFVTPLNRVADVDCDGAGGSDADSFAGAVIAGGSNCSGAAGDPGETRYNVDAGVNDTMIANNFGDYRVQFRMTTSSGVAYDRDENLVSGSTTALVRCVGGVDVTDLISSYSPSHVLSGGGWGYVQARVPTVDTATYGAQDASAVTGRAAVYKLEFNVGGTFNGEVVGGTFNNAFFMN